MLSAKRKLFLYLKNKISWSVNRRIVVFSVDDYGNVRMDSKEARDSLQTLGLNVNANRFDQYDSLENKEDLTGLFEVLSSVKDKNSRHPVFTAFALPANIDFERMADANYQTYYYEMLPQTFSKRPGYEGVWDLWKEGMSKGFLFPQYHGREHLNVKLLLDLLSKKDKEVMNLWKFHSYAALSKKENTQVSFVSAFDFDSIAEMEELKKIATEGLDVFEKVFGFKATHFNAPGSREHDSLESTLKDHGVRFIDTDSVKREHQGNGKYSRRLHYSGQVSKSGLMYLVRNAMFEPSSNLHTDVVDSCLSEIDMAFSMNRPANISSHRVNFCGHINPAIRDKGLADLKRLLASIVKRWPDVEFLTTVELGELMRKSKGVKE